MKNMNTSNKQVYTKIACFLFVLSINTISLLLFLLIASLISKNMETKLTLLRFVFIPISSFVSGYFSFLLTTKIKIASIVSLIVVILGPILIFGFSFQIFLWAILYFLNAFVGFSLAMCSLRS